MAITSVARSLGSCCFKSVLLLPIVGDFVSLFAQDCINCQSRHNLEKQRSTDQLMHLNTELARLGIIRNLSEITFVTLGVFADRITPVWGTFFSVVFAGSAAVNIYRASHPEKIL